MLVSHKVPWAIFALLYCIGMEVCHEQYQTFLFFCTEPGWKTPTCPFLVCYNFGPNYIALLFGAISVIHFITTLCFLFTNIFGSSCGLLCGWPRSLSVLGAAMCEVEALLPCCPLLSARQAGPSAHRRHASTPVVRSLWAGGVIPSCRGSTPYLQLPRSSGVMLWLCPSQLARRCSRTRILLLPR